MSTLSKRILGFSIVLFAAGSLTWSFVNDPYGDVKGYLPPSDKVVAYYFLIGSKRCDTCKKIEAWTHKAVESYPAGDAVEFSLVNADAEANAHFREEFSLGGKAVVVAHYASGERKGWVNCEDIWSWAPEGEAAYIKHIHAAMDAVIQGAKP